MKKIIRQTVSAFMAAAMLTGMTLGSSLCFEPNVMNAEAAKKAKITTATNIKLEIGRKTTIKLTYKKKNAKYSFSSSSKKVATVNAKGVVKAVGKGKAVIKIKEKIKGSKKAVKIGAVNIIVRTKGAAVTSTFAPSNNSMPAFSNAPTKAPEIQPTPTATPTLAPIPSGTPDVYTEELFSMAITEKGSETVEGTTCTVEMQLFDAVVTGDKFEGSTKANACNSNVSKTYTDGKVTSQARFILEGTDSKGNSCQIYIQDDGVMTDNVVLTRPIIFTDSKELEWLETADIQGRVVTDADGKKTVKYMYNPSGDKFTPPLFCLSDKARDYTKEIFTFYIGIGASDEVKGSTGTSTMIHFTCKGECENFNGQGIKGFDFVDTRHKIPGRVETLSARYILEGTDKNGNPCKIYVENNGVDDNGMVTEPTIITDCPDYGWIETAPLRGTVSWEKGLTIHVWAEE